jgi:hypothetical protein
MKKESQVVMLTTEKAENCILSFSNRGKVHYEHHDQYFTQSYLGEIGAKSHHLYGISSDEIPKDGDWAIRSHDNVLFKVNSQSDHKHYACKKVIWTTNESLTIKGNCNCFATTYEGCSECLERLPKPKNEFLKKFCELGGVDKVLVEYEMAFTGYEGTTGFENWDKRLKVAPDNTITIYTIEQ